MKERTVLIKHSIVDWMLGYFPGQKVHFRWDWRGQYWRVLDAIDAGVARTS